MKPTVFLANHIMLLCMTLLLVIAGCTTPSNQQPTIAGPLCSISWDKTSNQKVTGYQLTVIDHSGQAKKTVRFIPADITKISCKDAGANHEGLWDVTVQSCFDKSTCGPPTEISPMQITTK